MRSSLNRRGGVLMDIMTYAIESEVEQTHWWFVMRRKLFAN